MTKAKNLPSRRQRGERKRVEHSSNRGCLLEKIVAPIIDEIKKLARRFYNGQSIPSEDSVRVISELCRDVLLLMKDYQEASKALITGPYFYLDKDCRVLNVTKEVISIRKKINELNNNENYYFGSFLYYREDLILKQLLHATESLVKNCFKNHSAWELGGAEMFLFLGTHINECLGPEF